MMNIFQVRDYIVRPALEEIGLWSEAAERLVIGTGLTESRFEYIDQVESRAGDKRPGPAYGFFQLERATHNDMWDRWIRHRPDLEKKLRTLMTPAYDPVFQLHGNHFYAAAMCRIFYARVPAPLPKATDLKGMADYWKRFYNTPIGKGTPQDFMTKAEKILQL